MDGFAEQSHWDFSIQGISTTVSLNLARYLKPESEFSRAIQLEACTSCKKEIVIIKTSWTKKTLKKSQFLMKYSRFSFFCKYKSTAQLKKQWTKDGGVWTEIHLLAASNERLLIPGLKLKIHLLSPVSASVNDIVWQFWRLKISSVVLIVPHFFSWRWLLSDAWCWATVSWTLFAGCSRGVQVAATSARGLHSDWHSVSDSEI